MLAYAPGTKPTASNCIQGSYAHSGEARFSMTPPEPATFDLQAAMLRTAEADQRGFAAALASRLTEACPRRVTIDRVGWGLLRERRVARITIAFDATAYVLALDGATFQAERRHTVKGITLRTEPMPLAEWLDALNTQLTQFAGQQTGATSVLHHFLIA